MADREGDEGKMPLEYLYSAMQMEKYSGAASIEVVSFTLCTVPPLSLFVFYRPSLRYLFPFLSFFFFYIFLHFSLSSLSSSSVLSFHLLWFDVGRGCTYLARNNDSVIGFTPPRISFCAVRPWSFFDKYVPRIIRRFRGEGGILRKGMFAFSVSPQFRGIGWPTRFEIKFQFWDFLFSAARWHGERDSIRQDKGRVRFGGKYLKNGGAYIFLETI